MLLDDDHLLTTPTARALFHERVADLPLIDYHCHLDPGEILADQNFSGIVEAWLGGDHYKWRLMRANGVPEELITGSASDWEKFEAFAGAMEKALGNPVYLWTNLELRRLFGIEEPLSRTNARAIFDQANEMLAAPEYSRRGLLRRFKVEAVCTTDDAHDNLANHLALREQDEFTILPTFRPDGALRVSAPGYAEWLGKLEVAAGTTIDSFADLVTALESRTEFFASLGGSLSDHALDPVRFAEPQDLDGILSRGRAGEAITEQEISAYQTGLLLELMRIYREHGWTMQLHANALRNISTSGLANLGPDTGYDAIDDSVVARPLAALIDRAASAGNLPRGIFYSLNPADWNSLAGIMGSFQGNGRQQLQLGAAWWFNDHRGGIRAQLQAFAEHSLLGNFVGMTTDSRSFLSYTRHEFFRRILCELVGEWVERGEVPADLELLGDFVEAISYTNAREMVLGSGAGK